MKKLLTEKHYINLKFRSKEYDIDIRELLELIIDDYFEKNPIEKNINVRNDKRCN